MRALVVVSALLGLASGCAPGIRPDAAPPTAPGAPAAAAAPAPAPAPPPTFGSAFAPFQILAGDWDGTGDGATGPSHGAFSLVADRDAPVLIRRSSNISATAHHTDLMIISADAGRFRALYFDDEGHQIAYTVTPSATGTGLVFLSDEVSGAPRFRLTYDMTGDHGVVTFEIAPPGSTELRAYVSGSLRRATGAAPAKPQKP